MNPGAGSPGGPAGDRLPHLDMLRGIAALMVCVGHTRGFVFVDYAEGPPGPLTQIFYLLTGRHHQAVILFFVLSGFLVGGSVLRAHARGIWSWRHYSVQRLGRLWIVIVPALLLTWLWDRLGQGANPAAYDSGLWPILQSGPNPDTGDDLSVATILGNLFFLQTITVPPLGSNGPLWSLANEFWYYVLFPLLVVAFRAGAALGRILAGAAALALLLLLPFAISQAFVIWLFGVAAYVCAANGVVPRGAVRVLGMSGLAVMVLLLLASAKWPGSFSDFGIGLACACALPWLAQASGPGRLYDRLGRGLSEISYTLYLVHFPLLMFLYAAFLAPRQFTLSAGSLALFAASIAVTLAYAVALWFLFERNTDRWRRLIEMRLRRHSAPVRGETA